MERRKLIIAAAVSLLAVAFAVHRLKSSSPISNSVLLVCVSTGETFNITRKELVCIPMTNPRTGEATLLPCHERNGVLYINQRYGSILGDLGARNRYVDPETLAVRTPP
ncbi:MAG: hypothetical protein KBH81_03430 [Phycisphaerae bacterium]|nr:hypothetical protein [Phycisphaerae bacterium]HOO16038.1 hypothetical protein [Phycisphaerae bacterium]HPC23168.1 hypothetical protein [Phycisphaerae bacterium]HRS27471.1 hypothetical protein [Phycisphaerae bacterium]HRT40518.1 hypothetical protein [Phycisphaerae bacterium]